MVSAAVDTELGNRGIVVKNISGIVLYTLTDIVYQFYRRSFSVIGSNTTIVKFSFLNKMTSKLK